ncbi:hypothetical protein EDB86DRAFT_2828686 [Lactarius hatsudake]|nr:hypothetical protein EDB86DRAFT_2828686 [Lactarius hatsudake]
MTFADGRNGIHQSGAFAKGRGEGIKDVDGRIQPFCEFVIAERRLFELLDLSSKDGQDVVETQKMVCQWKEEEAVDGVRDITTIAIRSSVRSSFRAVSTIRILGRVTTPAPSESAVGISPCVIPSHKATVGAAVCRTVTHATAAAASTNDDEDVVAVDSDEPTRALLVFPVAATTTATAVAICELRELFGRGDCDAPAAVSLRRKSCLLEIDSGHFSQRVRIIRQIRTPPVSADCFLRMTVTVEGRSSSKWRGGFIGVVTAPEKAETSPCAPVPAGHGHS